MSSILSYRMGLAHSCDFGDEDKLRQHLLILVNHILSKARETVDSTNHKEGVDYWTVQINIFEVAAGSSYLAEGTAGCVTESLLLASMNLHTSHSLALSGTIQSQIPSSGLHTDSYEWGIRVKGIHHLNKSFSK